MNAKILHLSKTSQIRAEYGMVRISHLKASLRDISKVWRLRKYVLFPTFLSGSRRLKLSSQEQLFLPCHSFHPAKLRLSKNVPKCQMLVRRRTKRHFDYAAPREIAVALTFLMFYGVAWLRIVQASEVMVPSMC